MKTRRCKEDWQELIVRQSKSGLSAQQFCHDNCQIKSELIQFITIYKASI